MVKNLPAMQETRVDSLGREDPLEVGMTSHSSILAWRIPWTEEPGRLQFMGSKESDTTEATEHAPCTHKTQESGGARSDDSTGLPSPAESWPGQK